MCLYQRLTQGEGIHLLSPRPPLKVIWRLRGAGGSVKQTVLPRDKSITHAIKIQFLPFVISICLTF